MAVQHERIQEELKEIRGKLELAIEQAQKASDLHGQASESKRVDLKEQLKEDANKCFVEADDLIEEGCNGMKAWIITDHAWLRLDQAAPPYEEIIKMYTKALELHDKSRLPTGLFPKYTILGKAIAEVWLDKYGEAVESLNRIGKDIARLDDLYKNCDLKPRDVKKFKDLDELNLEVIEYLKEAESFYLKNKKVRCK